MLHLSQSYFDVSPVKIILSGTEPVWILNCGVTRINAHIGCQKTHRDVNPCEWFQKRVKYEIIEKNFKKGSSINVWGWRIAQRWRSYQHWEFVISDTPMAYRGRAIEFTHQSMLRKAISAFSGYQRALASGNHILRRRSPGRVVKITSEINVRLCYVIFT